MLITSLNIHATKHIFHIETKRNSQLKTKKKKKRKKEKTLRNESEPARHLQEPNTTFFYRKTFSLGVYFESKLVNKRMLIARSKTF